MRTTHWEARGAKNLGRAANALQACAAVLLTTYDINSALQY